MLEAEAFLLSSFALITPPLVLVLVMRPLHRDATALYPIILPTFFFVFHACAALIRSGAGEFRLTLILILTTLITFVVSKIFLINQAKEIPSVSSRQLQLIAFLALVAVITDAWVFNLQGFSFNDGGSRFAAPFTGDHWRHTAIIAGILRNDQAVFFPDSELVYQVLWHHGAAAVIGSLPKSATLFKYELGYTLFTGYMFYFSLLWLIAVVAQQAMRRWYVLALIIAVIGADADFYNAVLSKILNGQVAIAADSSTRIPSPFRYFSLKLVSLTAPQHASFFIFTAILIAGLITKLQHAVSAGALENRSWLLITAAGIAAAIFSPILAALLFPFIFAAIQIAFAVRGLSAIRALVKSGMLIVAGTVIFHWLILGFPVWDLFLRPNLTGGGSGNYGLKLFPVFDLQTGLLSYLPLALVSMLGVLGVLLTVGLIWALFNRREVFRDPIVLTFIGGVIFWNLIIVDTEIQRHFTMAAAFLAVIIIAAHFPKNTRWRIAGPGVALIGGLICLLLNAYLVRAYTYNARFMPLTSGWPDYFCINELMSNKYRSLPVVVATPQHFELPITVEASTSLVWSQVAAVHQRMTESDARTLDLINPRDWRTFRLTAEREGEEFISQLRSLGYKAVIWGGIEEKEYGEKVKQLFVRKKNYLDACGSVGLFSLDQSMVDSPQPGYEEYLRHLNNPERMVSREAPDAVQLRQAGDRLQVVGKNIALLSSIRSSSGNPKRNAFHAIDGQSGSKAPIAITGNEFLPWIELDFGEIVDLGVLRILASEHLDGDQYKLRDFYILVSSRPLISGTPLGAMKRDGAAVYFVSGTVNNRTDVLINHQARYVRIQASDQRHLVLSEVEAYERGASN